MVSPGLGGREVAGDGGATVVAKEGREELERALETGYRFLGITVFATNAREHPQLPGVQARSVQGQARVQIAAWGPVTSFPQKWLLRTGENTLTRCGEWGRRRETNCPQTQDGRTRDWARPGPPPPLTLEPPSDAGLTAEGGGSQPFPRGHASLQHYPPFHNCCLPPQCTMSKHVVLPSLGREACQLPKAWGQQEPGQEAWPGPLLPGSSDWPAVCVPGRLLAAHRPPAAGAQGGRDSQGMCLPHPKGSPGVPSGSGHQGVTHKGHVRDLSGEELTQQR